MLNFEFPKTEIRCSSFPPHRQLVSLSKSSSSPVSACFPSSSTFSVLTALSICSCLVCACIHPLTSALAVTTLTPHFSPCFEFVHALSIFIHLTPHLPPHLQAVLITYPQACVACLWVLSSSLICRIHTPLSMLALTLDDDGFVVCPSPVVSTPCPNLPNLTHQQTTTTTTATQHNNDTTEHNDRQRLTLTVHHIHPPMPTTAGHHTPPTEQLTTNTDNGSSLRPTYTDNSEHHTSLTANMAHDQTPPTVTSAHHHPPTNSNNSPVLYASFRSC